MIMLVLISGLFVTLIEARTVCYHPFGCFNNGFPFNSFFRVLPQPPSTVQTRFHLYTRASSEPQKISAFNLKSIQNSAFDGSKQTVVIAHGWRETKSEKWIPKMTTALLKKQDMNVILVGWGGGSVQHYHKAVSNCRLVGKQISYLLGKLRYGFSLKMSLVHLIGFSLGAHVMGYAGRDLRRKSHIVRRITGLDPAGPLFERTERAVRLDSSDAKFVDVIHTYTLLNAIIASVGIARKSGHIDFYPNGGKTQPGCGWKQSITCSHKKSIAYFTDSINSKCRFRSHPCRNYKNFAKGYCTTCPPGGCPEMGYNAEKYSKSAKGKFYLLTSKKAPYCVHYYKISFTSGSRWYWFGLYLSIVKVQLFGVIAKTTVIHLPRRTFKRSSTQSFIIGTRSKLGSLKRVAVTKTSLQSWLLKRVTVKALESGKKYTAYYDQWMKKSKITTRKFKRGR